MTNGEHSETRTIGGKVYTFRKLTRRDWQALAARCWEDKRTSLAPDLRVLMGLGLTQGQLPLILAEFSRKPTETEVWRWIHTGEGADEANAISASVPLEEVKSWPNALDYIEIAVTACGLKARAEAGDGRAPLSSESTATIGTPV